MDTEMMTYLFISLVLMILWAVALHRSKLSSLEAMRAEEQLYRDLAIANFVSEKLSERLKEVGISGGGRWFCIDSSDNVQIFDAAYKAMDAAKDALRRERAGVDYKGAPVKVKVEVTEIMWGRVLGRKEPDSFMPRVKAALGVLDLLAACKSALAIQDLWLYAEDCEEEYRDDAAALSKMKRQLEAAVAKAEQCN